MLQIKLKGMEYGAPSEHVFCTGPLGVVKGQNIFSEGLAGCLDVTIAFDWDGKTTNQTNYISKKMYLRFYTLHWFTPLNSIASRNHV